jgi:hypothetical protein
MSLTTADFDRIDARDIEQLVTAGVSEGLTIEFKKTTYDRKNFSRMFLLLQMQLAAI